MQISEILILADQGGTATVEFYSTDSEKVVVTFRSEPGTGLVQKARSLLEQFATAEHESVSADLEPAGDARTSLFAKQWTRAG